VEELLTNEEGCDIYIVGTKLDLIQEGTERGRSASEVKEYALKIGAKVFETSSKSGDGIDELFHDIAETYLIKLTTGNGGNGTNQTEGGTSKVKVNTAGVEKEKKCCGS